VGDAPTLSAAAQRPRAGAHFSAMHNMPMRYQENARGGWWSHATADGWCTGTERQPGAGHTLCPLT